MKKALNAFLKVSILLICLFAIRPAMAQDKASMLKNTTPEQRAQFQTNMMKAKLQLDSVQSTKVQAINLEYAKKLAPVLEDGGGRFAKLRKLKTIQDDKNKDLKAVLTKDQYKQYQDLEAEMKEKIMEKAKEKDKM